MKGYSTGMFVSSEYSINSVIIDSEEKVIDTDALIPAKLGSTKDIFNKDLEFIGKARYNVQITDILTFKANGSTWGRMTNPSRVQFSPGMSTFSIWLCAEYVEGQNAVLLLCGNRYRIEFLNNYLRVTVGNEYADFEVDEGVGRYVFNIDTTTCTIYYEGEVLGSFTIGTVYSSGGNFDILADNEIVIADEICLVFIGILGRLTEEVEMLVWFQTSDIVTDFEGAYYFYTKANIIFDLTESGNHIELQNYDVTVWSGRQSVMAYLCEGFSEIFISRNYVEESIIVPYSLKKNKIQYNYYGADQFEIEYKATGGMLVFDAFIDMNPENLELGFWTVFWNKLSSTIWRNITSENLLSNTYKWHLKELNMTYIVQALYSEYYNFAFVGINQGKENFVTEIVDLVLLNLGNNFKYKQIPI
jgi:hypothetical protein